MRQVLHALIVATIALAMLAMLASAVRAETLGRTAGAPQEGQQRNQLYATVVRQYGAAIRVGPSSDAPIMFSAGCGDIWPVLETSGGWVKVRTDAGSGWIGGGRVVVTTATAFADCSVSRFIYPTGYVTTYVETGCLSLRATPSREAAIRACVKNNHQYMVTDGPFDPGTGEDWFKVTSPSTGSGWVLAEHIYN